MTGTEDLLDKGWQAFGHDPALADWVEAALPVAREVEADPQARTDWLRCGGTWFAGVNIFPNDASGAVPGRVPPLKARALDAGLAPLGITEIALDPAQISICYPGYPQPWEGESEANFRFRRDRDAAHVDGLLRDAARNRSLGEVHGFILGIPLNECSPEASPMVVWEGSHEVMRAAFRERFAGLAPEDWRHEDITECYVATRRRVFETCRRVTVQVAPGSAYLVHRLALHGVAPWVQGAGETPRIIAYFRPDPFPGRSPEWWLDLP
ncbi:hypothetical protein KHP62_07085 [Rhodobacteraceae bacterium NNCM2]|nr:hypothetical protein [Coraliihabitans acroporae]